MAKYNYRAINAKGKTVKGSLEAENELDVSTQLAKLGLTPVNIGFKGGKELSFLGRFFKKGVKKVSTKNLIIFTRQFATIVRAAVPIVEGLGVLAEQTEDANLKEALHQVIHDIQEGGKLSSAMAKHPGIFSELYINTIVAGEAGGVLDKVLLRLAEMLGEDSQTRSSIKSAMRYPIMVVIALAVAMLVLSLWVIPPFAKIYKGFDVSLPLATQMMILIGKAVKGYWYLTLPALAGCFYLVKFLINTPKGRLWWDSLKFKLPVVGPVYKKIIMLRFSIMLNLLYQAGLPILKIMDIVKITIGNVLLSQEIDSAKKDVADGKGVSGAILASNLFPRLVGYMISVGEKTGDLPTMLDSLCEYFSLEVKTTMKNLTSLIEPIMTLFLGVAVVFMALGIFLPMWNIISVIKQAG